MTPTHETLHGDTHLWTGEAAPCWHCGTPTRWLDLAFEAPLCPGRCSDAKAREYAAAGSGWT
jgi:hypothetical protein